MTTLMPTKLLTPTQRTTAATQRAAQHLGLSEDKLLAAALTEAAAEEVLTSPVFAERVRRRYTELHTKPTRTRTSGSRPSANPTKSTESTGGPKPKTASQRTAGEHVDIASPLDPRILVPLYGASLPAHLMEYSVRALSQMARMLAPEVGVKAPPQKSGKEVLIAYIVRHMTG